MAKKEKKEEGGAPAWMVTFGDMMSLLLCFFVILVSMSEIKEDQRFQKVAESIKRAFGYKGGAGWIAANIPPTNSFDKKMDQLIRRKFQLQVGTSTEEGIEGENPSVKTIREGLEFTIGGQVCFEQGKARLLDQAKKQLVIFADIFRGMNTKICIRGHAAHKQPGLYRPFESLDDLSYARGTAVKSLLVEHGIRAERINVEACGVNEPLDSEAYDEVARAKNRRVSIIISENLVDQFWGQPTVGKDDVKF